MLHLGIVKPLFEELYAYFHSPLQVMLNSNETELIELLLSGGFKLTRKCYEIEAAYSDLKTVPLQNNRIVPETAFCGEREYLFCAEKMYAYYSDTHARINPLTADFGDFCDMLPKQVYYCFSSNDRYSIFFTDKNEIAYLCSSDTEHFNSFSNMLLSELFELYDTIEFECDDTDEFAMHLRCMFAVQQDASFDTYIYGL